MIDSSVNKNPRNRLKTEILLRTSKNQSITSPIKQKNESLIRIEDKTKTLKGKMSKVVEL
jgi:hypothetical protein